MNNTAIEQNTLLWVKQELDETLNQARQALEAYVEQPDDPSQLRFCAGHLHQVAGTLQMVEIYGASLLAEEMEKLVLDLVEDRVTQKEDACELLMQGIIQLPDYLERLAAGHRDIPLVLLPLLNDLRAIRGEPLLSENALFSPDLSRGIPVSVRGIQSDETPDPAALARRLRHRYQLGLLDWFRERDVEKGLAEIQDVLDQLLAASREEPVQRLWWVAGALARALREGLLETSMASKLLLGQVDRMIKRLIDEGEAGLAAQIPEDLLRNLLFYVGRSRPGNDDVDLVRQNWNLDRLLPDEDEIEEARESLSGHNQSLIESVTAAVREDLAALCEQFDVLLRAEQSEGDGLEALREPIQRVADTLGMIGMGALRRQILEQAERLDEAASATGEAREQGLQAMAEALVMVDTALEGLQSGALEQEMLEEEDGDIAEIVPASEFRQVRSVVTAEALKEIARAKEAFTEYLAEPSDLDRLAPVPALFEEVAGSLLLLEEAQAAQLLERVTEYVKTRLVTGDAAPDEETVLEPLAEAISAIEYYIENLNEPKVYGGEILEVAEAALARLGISAPPLHAVDESSTDAPAAEAAAPAEAPVEDESGVIEWSIEGLEDEAAPGEEITLGDLVTESAPEADSDDATGSLDEMTIEFDGDFLETPGPEAEEAVPEAPEEAQEAAEIVEPAGQVEEISLETEPEEEIDLGGVEADHAGPDAVEAAAEEIVIPEPGEIPPVEETLDSTSTPSEPADETRAVEAAELPPFESPWPVLEGDDIDEEILEIFLEEADEEIGNIRELLPRWLDDPEDAEALTEMRRSWHTLKGSGRLVGAMLIGEFAWAFENMLNRVIDGTVDRTPEMEGLLSRTLEALPQLVAQIRGEGDPAVDVLAMIEDAQALARGESIEVRDYARHPGSVAPVTEAAVETSEDSVVEAIEEIEIEQLAPVGEEEPLPLEEASDARDEPAEEIAVEEIAVEVEAEPATHEALDPELLAIFRREAEGHLATIEDYVQRARTRGDGVDEALVRATHTLHGSACMAGADPVARIARALEHHVKGYAASRSPLEEEALEAVEAAVDCVRDTLSRLAEPEAGLPDIDAVVERIESLASPASEDAPCAETLAAEAAEAEADAPVVEAADEPEVQEVSPVIEEIDASLPETEVVEEEGIDLEAGEPVTVVEEVVAPDAGAVSAEDAEILVPEVPEGEGEEVSAPPVDEIPVADEERPPAEPVAAEAGGEEEEVDPELLEIFLEEGEEILVRMEDVLGRWMEAPEDRELINAMQRELHTLKGGARMAGLTRVADLSHHLESFQIGIEEGRIPVTPDVFELMQLAHDRLVLMLEAVSAGQRPASPQDLIDRIEALRKGEPLPEAGTSASPSDEAAAEEADRAAGSEQAAVAAAMAARAEAAAAAPAPSAPAAERAPGEKQEMVRVRADLLDNMVNFAGEVSIYRARLEQQVGAYRFNLNELTQTVMRLREQLRQMEIETETQIVARYERETGDYAHEDFDPLEMDQYSTLQTLSRAMGESINDLLSIHAQLDAITKESETLLVQQARVSTELQEGLMRTRMVPFSGLAPRMRRIVRQACQELGKRAELVLEGAEGEMDRTVIERIIAPLEHMLRNAVAHGIEPPEVRREKGKRETGTIRVALHREGSEVVIRMSDDGAGMNVEAIRAKAVERGLIKPDAELSDREIIQFVLETGFSTAGEVTQIAGRGVGMDVVNSEVKQLGGTLSIDSTPGAGTTITIRLPFTLAISQALMVRVGEELYAIPLTSIEGVVRMSQEELQNHYANPEQRFEYAGYEYQVRHLGTLLGQERPPFGKGTPRRLPVLLVRSGDQHMAVQVDALLGSREAVVKSVGPQISTVRGVSGATILGDGRVVLILDMAGLLRNLETMQAALEEAEAEAATREEEVSERPPLVMVVDDSITVRKVTTRLLERNDMQVITAKDGVDAVGKLQDHVPDIMLLDIEMPRMDGFELATHIRNEPRLRHIPIIMITSRTGEKHRKRAMDIGVDRYLGKPYQEADLLETMKELMEARSAHA